MAGSYDDAPSRRIAYDDDGSLVLERISQNNGLSYGPLAGLTEAQKAEINDEDNVLPTGLTQLNSNAGWGYYIWIYPELREFDGMFVATPGTHIIAADVDTSGDTTNGVDGTWTNRTSNLAEFQDTYANFRDEITSFAVSNVRGVRVLLKHTSGGIPQGIGMQTTHLYGEIASGETPDRLLWVDNATGLEFALPIDYGDIPRGSAEDYDVKLRNNSGSLTASSVQCTVEDLYLGSSGWYVLKEAGGSFASTLALLSSIGSGSDSPVITLRRNTPDDETLGLHVARMYANVGSWS